MPEHRFAPTPKPELTLSRIKMTIPKREADVIKIGTLPTDVTIYLDMDAADDLLDQLKMLRWRRIEIAGTRH